MSRQYTTVYCKIREWFGKDVSRHFVSLEMRDQDDLPLVQVAYVGDPPFKVLSATGRPKGLDDVMNNCRGDEPTM